MTYLGWMGNCSLGLEPEGEPEEVHPKGVGLNPLPLKLSENILQTNSPSRPFSKVSFGDCL